MVTPHHALCSTRHIPRRLEPSYSMCRNTNQNNFSGAQSLCVKGTYDKRLYSTTVSKSKCPRGLYCSLIHVFWIS